MSDGTDLARVLAGLDAETFMPHTGETFALVDNDGNRLALTLRSVIEKPEAAPANAARTPFELLFQGPADRWVPAGTYILRHATLGDFPPMRVGPVLDPGAPTDDEGRSTVTYQICVT